MKHWPTKPLGEVCAINPRLAVAEAPAADTDVTFVGMAAVDEVSGSIARPECRQYSQVAKGYTSFRENDVLFAKITPCMQNGKAAVARNLCNGFGFGSTEFHVLRPTKDMLPQWVFAFIRQPQFRTIAEANFTGSGGQQRVPADFLKNFPVPVPPLMEQERIVQLLDEADELRKLRAQVDRRTATLIPALFHEMFGDPATNAKRWAIKPLPELIYFQEGPGVRKWQFRSTGVKLVNVGNIVKGRLDLSKTDRHLDEAEVKKSYSHFLLNAGDLVMASSGATWGKVAFVEPQDLPLCLNTSVVRFRPIKDGTCDSAFMRAFFETQSFRRQIDQLITGSAQPNFGPSHLAQIRIPAPPLPLQKEFARHVTEIRELEASQTASRLRLEALLQSMLHRAFNGEL